MGAVQAIKRAVTGKSPYRLHLETLLAQAQTDARGGGLDEAERAAEEALVAEQEHRANWRGSAWIGQLDQEASDTPSPDGAQNDDGSPRLVTPAQALYIVRSAAQNRALSIRTARQRGQEEAVRLTKLLSCEDDIVAARNAVAAARADLRRSTEELAKLDATIAGLEVQVASADEAHRAASLAEATQALDAELAGGATSAIDATNVDALRIKLDRLTATVKVARDRRPSIEAALADAEARRAAAADDLATATHAKARYEFAELLHGNEDVIARAALAEGAQPHGGLVLRVDRQAVERARLDLERATRA